MKPTKPFLVTLALVAIGALVALPNLAAREAAAQEGLPLSTKLTPAMIEYFGLADAYARPSVAALVQCRATTACGSSDSTQVRFLDDTGQPVASYDGKPTTTIEQNRRSTTISTGNSRETRTQVRRYQTDERGRLVMNGVDSVLKVDGGTAATTTRVQQFHDVRYLENDPRFVWPITGLVTMEITTSIAQPQRPTTRASNHAAISFDGTHFAHVLTDGALTHRVNLKDRLLETTVPDRD
jgi:hypothetical protein